ncbi:S8 family serine peptidase [Pararhodobacter sp.]|uniref:S8 family serine peptidase n=1 Tax=Pararhodobacter sp. TaxID=2127056 RepID=UPI002FDD73E1
MLMLCTSRLRGALGALVLAAAASFSAPALANENLSSATLQRLTEPRAIVDALSDSTSGRIPVIVEFATPELPALAVQSAGSSVEVSEAADAALTAAVHGAQSSILARVLELPDAGAFSAALSSDELNIKRMDFSPMFGIVADAALLERLAADPMVVGIHLDGLDAPMMRNSLPLIGMPAAFAAGATGNNWRVAVLDTGGRRSHEFLSRQIVAAACYSTTDASQGSTSICPGGASSSTNIASADDCSRATIAGCGHGTHVAGTAAGFNLNPNGVNPDFGVARNARIISINVFSQFARDSGNCGSLGPQFTGGCALAYVTDQIRGLERVYALRNSMNIAAVNMSLGGGQRFSACDTDTRKPIIDQLRAAGIATLIAAGNDGSTSYIGAPACISSAIAVASSTSTDQRSSFSNWNSLVGLVAPGSNIVSSVVNTNNAYESYNGTSMATPHVAGAFAALRSAVPGASVDQILAALQSTGTPITAGGVTRGRINVDLALGVLNGARPTNTNLTGPASSTPGQSVTFTATVSTTGGGTPTGSVTFRNGGSALGTVALSGGTASFSTALLPAGSNQITAAYGGSGTHGPSTSAVLTHTVTAGGGTRPVNDDFANAIILTDTGRFTGSNVGATAEPGEPLHAGIPGARNSVWWRGTTAVSGLATIDTFGSNFDTVLAVYTGSVVNGLTPVAANDDSGGLQSRVQFNAQAGVVYSIAVAGYAATDSGNIVLNVAAAGGGSSDVEVSLSVPGGVVRPGAPARLVADVRAVNPATGTPSGTVRFSANGTTVGNATLSAGRATLNATLPVGSNSVIAHYLGTGTHNAGQSAAQTVLVSAVMGTETTVNQRTRHNQQRPVISALGRAAVVVFEDQLVANGPFGITAQRVNWAGSPNGDAIEVAPPAEGTSFPHVAQMAGGSWVVVWEAMGQGGRQDVFMRRFRANGRAIDGLPQPVNASNRGNQTAPRVAALEDGGYVVVWQSDSADGNGDGIVMRLFEASGAPRTGEVVVNSTTAGDQRGPDVTVQQGGDIVVSWAGPTATGFGAFVRRASLAGVPLGNDSIVGQAGNSLMPQVRVAALDNGNFAVAHEASDRLNQPGPYRVMVQRLRQRGPLWGDALAMQRIIDGDQRTPAISGLRRMGLATAWRAPDGGLNGVWVQTVGRDGLPIGAPERVNSTIAGNQFEPAVARVGTTRNFFVVWTASGTAPGDGTNIIIRRFMGP